MKNSVNGRFAPSNSNIINGTVTINVTDERQYTLACSVCSASSNYSTVITAIYGMLMATTL